MIIACDIGLKRIGLAQKLNGIILPLPPIFRKNRIQASMELKELLVSKKANTLVVGIPTNEDGSPHEMEARIKHFISLVDFDGEIIYLDESISSMIASERISSLNKKERENARKNGELDSISAMVILERL